MMAQNHLLAGYIIYRIVPDPLIAISLSFLSHPLLDLFPYPSKEMKIDLQEGISTTSERVTFYFVESMSLLLTIVFILLFFNRGMNLTGSICLVVSLIIDIVQPIWIIIGKRRKTPDEHKLVFFNDPYVNMFIHQLFTLSGFLYLIYL